MVNNESPISVEDFLANNPGINPGDPELQNEGVVAVVIVPANANVTGGGQPMSGTATQDLAALIKEAENVPPYAKNEIINGD